MTRFLPLFLLFCLYDVIIYDVIGQSTTEERISKLENITQKLLRQQIMQHLHVSESSRSTVNSGIKQIRKRSDGEKPYFSETYAGKTFMGTHNHPEHIATAGLGELVVVLNGIEFRTRHNDYTLRSSSTTSGEYNAVQDVEFPQVPPEVLAKSTVEEQILEMREWFKAWQLSDHSVRDYRNYFKPHLAYMEGFWTTDGHYEEPFLSDRHKLDADTWQELHNQIQYSSYVGGKGHKENQAYLPTAIFNVTDDGEPVEAQFNYRILVHPISRNIDLTQLKPVETLANRMAYNKSFNDYAKSKQARYRVVQPKDEDPLPERWTYMDELMYEVPGLDNYQGSISGFELGVVKYTMKNITVPVNTAFYHRVYQVDDKDAMGHNAQYTGFHDSNLYVAENTQPKVHNMSLRYCQTSLEKKNNECQYYSKRMSYAIPLEIIYLTPLHRWNPYDLEYKGDIKSDLGKTVKADNRDGKLWLGGAFNGTNSKVYYLTPVEFFLGGDVEITPGDTNSRVVGVLSRNGSVYHKTSASGLRNVLPDIPGIGYLKTRFPVAPVSCEGDAISKEVQALRDIVLDMEEHLRFIRYPYPDSILPDVYDDFKQTLTTSISTEGGNHSHTITLTWDSFKSIRWHGRTELLETSKVNGHSHWLHLRFDKDTKVYYLAKCNGGGGCFGGHSDQFNVL